MMLISGQEEWSAGDGLADFNVSGSEFSCECCDLSAELEGVSGCSPHAHEASSTPGWQISIIDLKTFLIIAAPLDL